MKLRNWTLGFALFLMLAAGAAATTYYIDDNSNDGDVYTPMATGNPANNALSPSTPKDTINNLLASTNLTPGDVVLIDTGIYTNVLIGTSVTGAPGNRIVFQGSTNLAARGATFTGSGNIIDVRGNYLHFRDIRSTGGSYAFTLNGAQFCEFERVFASGSAIGIHLAGASNSNVFRRCTILSQTAGAFRPFSPATGNYLENCVAISRDSAAFALVGSAITNIIGCIGQGSYVLGIESYPQFWGSRNIFLPTIAFSPNFETLADFQAAYTNWANNAIADPKFVDSAGLDFHLLSAAGFVSNGVWVTNPAVGFSPGIDFGAKE